MKAAISRVLLLALTAALIPACGGGGGNGGGSGSSAPTSITGGGSALGPPATSFGGSSGNINFSSQGELAFGVNGPKAASATPAAPAGGPEITSLSADVVLAGSGTISGTLTGAGAASRSITVGGDLLISGTLRNGQFNNAEIALTINATSGTVYISGAVLGTSNDGTLDGTSGGNITINAQQIVLRGLIESKGESTLANGGNGGQVVLSTTGLGGGSIFVHGGTVDVGGGAGGANGGDAGIITLNAGDDIEVYSRLLAEGGAVTGSLNNVIAGDGGTITVHATDALSMNSTLRTAGGNAVTTGDGALGGTGGIVNLQRTASSGEASLFGTLELPGGSAAASPTGLNNVTGGSGGTCSIGNGTGTAPSRVDLPAAALRLIGGDSSGFGGDGAGSSNLQAATGIVFNGTASIDGGASTRGSGDASADLNFFAVAGNIVINGSLSGNGGDGSDISNGISGAGEQFSFQTFNGNIIIDAVLTSNGASATGLIDRNGAAADGGSTNFSFYTLAVGSTVSFSSGTRITSNGGAGAGNGSGGEGGATYIQSDGAVTIGGVHVAKGGAGSGTGTGGLGGLFQVLSDSNNDGTGGAITLESGASITVSGGPGALGGSGRATAVLFDADGPNTNAATAGVVLNNGTITATGGATDGNGGGVVFDGLNGGGTTGPAEGSQNRAGNGVGTTGAFTPQ